MYILKSYIINITNFEHGHRLNEKRWIDFFFFCKREEKKKGICIKFKAKY